MIKRNSLPIIVIILISALLRLGTVHKLMAFTPDEEYQVYLAQTLIKHFHVIWIGMSAGGFDLYLGPLWIYIIYPFLDLFKGNPLTIGYISSLLGVVATFLVFYLGKIMFNQRVGLIASLLYACSPLIVYYDQKPYPSGMSVLSLLIAISLYSLKQSNRWWIVFVLSYAMVFNIHLSLILLVFVGIYWAIIKREFLTKRVLLISLILFLMMISPLIAFDYFHKGSNITTPLRILKAHKTLTQPISSYHLNTLFMSFGRIWFLKPFNNSADEILYPCTKTQISSFTKPPWIISLISLSIFLFFALSRNTWGDERKRLLLLMSLSFLAPFIILSIINPVEYYLVGFFPLLLLITSTVIDSSKIFKKELFAIFILVALFGAYSVVTAKGDYGLETKEKMVGQVMGVIGNNRYDLSESGDCHKYEGWRYIFSTFGRKPERSSDDPTFSWLYRDQVSTLPSKYFVIVNEYRSNTIIKPGYNFSITQGGFTAYLYENHSFQKTVK